MGWWEGEGRQKAGVVGKARGRHVVWGGGSRHVGQGNAWAGRGWGNGVYGMGVGR